ncbi:MAG: glycine oxidase ThiO [Pyrinomonadaceae bacterium]
MNSDFVIIGGGVIGLTIARELHRRGAGTITVIDRGRAGGEASWAAAGMLAPNVECRADDELFRICTASNRLYPDFAAELLAETGIDIHLDRSGTLSLAFTEDEAAELNAKYTWQRNAGITVESLTSDDIRKLEPEISASVHSGFLYPNDWQVENRQLVAGLRKYCELNQIELIENTAMERLVIRGGEARAVETSRGAQHADRVIVTAGAWSDQLLPVPKVKPIRGQMISLAASDPRILDRVIYSHRGYLVPRSDGRVLVGATVENVGFSKEVTADAISTLKAAAIEIAPRLAKIEIAEAWAGLRPFVEGEMPVIGRVPDIENAFVATGHYRNGILLAPITAKMIADEVCGASRTSGDQAVRKASH